MTTLLRTFWQALTGQSSRDPAVTTAPPVERPRPSLAPPLEIAPDDPAIPYFLSVSGPVEVERLNLDSPAVRALKAGGVKLTVPLVAQGELIGLLHLGPRQSEQDYSGEDRALLNNLATQAAPAVRVAQLVRQQQLEARARERLEQELRVARLIQQTLLPKELPELSGWQIAAYYQPARAVGGDFYDFIQFPDGRLGLVVGDVTDKGVPAALVMATTRAILRGAAQRLASPGEVLQRTNDLLCPDIPRNMFVTCLYAVLDPASGQLRYANAGHDVPYRRTADGVTELRATGMPLGLMPGMTYEEKEARLAPGESVLFYSDGLVEAHAPDHQMFSFPRLSALVATHSGGAALIECLLKELAAFTGADWEQEDDVMLVTLQRASPPPPPSSDAKRRARGEPHGGASHGPGEGGEDWQTLAEFTLPSQAGNEREVIRKVAEAVPTLLAGPRLERLKTAVAEATMNAIEHGNQNRPELPVNVELRASKSAIAVRITDRGGGRPIPDPEAPNLEAKLAGLQTPRGWGLFLIEKMVDEMNVISDDFHHTVELVMFREDK